MNGKKVKSKEPILLALRRRELEGCRLNNYDLTKRLIRTTYHPCDDHGRIVSFAGIKKRKIGWTRDGHHIVLIRWTDESYISELSFFTLEFWRFLSPRKEIKGVLQMKFENVDLNNLQMHIYESPLLKELFCEERLTVDIPSLLFLLTYPKKEKKFNQQYDFRRYIISIISTPSFSIGTNQSATNFRLSVEIEYDTTYPHPIFQFNNIYLSVMSHYNNKSVGISSSSSTSSSSDNDNKSNLEYGSENDGKNYVMISILLDLGWNLKLVHLIITNDSNNNNNIITDNRDNVVKIKTYANRIIKSIHYTIPNLSNELLSLLSLSYPLFSKHFNIVDYYHQIFDDESENSIRENLRFILALLLIHNGTKGVVYRFGAIFSLNLESGIVTNECQLDLIPLDKSDLNLVAMGCKIVNKLKQDFKNTGNTTTTATTATATTTNFMDTNVNNNTNTNNTFSLNHPYLPFVLGSDKLFKLSKEFEFKEPII